MAIKKYIAIFSLTPLAVMAQIVFAQKVEAEMISITALLSLPIGMTAQELPCLVTLPEDRIMAALVARGYCLNGAIAVYKDGTGV